MDIKNEIEKLLGELDAVLKLADEGLLKSERYYRTKYTIEDKLKELSCEFDERTQLIIEKTIPQWRNEPKSGIFLNKDQVKDSAQLHSILVNLIDKHSDKREVTKEVGGMKLPEGFAIGPIIFSKDGKTASSIVGPAIIPFNYGITNALNRLSKTTLPPDEFQDAFNSQVEALVSEMLIYFRNRLKVITKTRVGEFSSVEKYIKEYKKYSIDLEKICDTKFLLDVDAVRGRKHHSNRRYDPDYSIGTENCDSIEKLRNLNRRVHQEIHRIDEALLKSHKDYDVKVTQSPNSLSVEFTAKNHAFDFTKGGKIVPKKPEVPPPETGQ